VVSPSSIDRIGITSANYGIAISASRENQFEGNTELPLLSAAVEWFDKQGFLERGIQIFTASEVPPGTGLGSSSAMAVAMFVGLAAYSGVPMDPGKAAQLASWVELERLARPIGKQDQYACSFGGLNSIRFGPGEGVQVRRLQVSPSFERMLERSLTLFAIGRSRDSATILRQQSYDAGVSKETVAKLHKIKSLAHEAESAVQSEDLLAIGEILHEGWMVKRELSSSVSSSEIDAAYDAACQAGATGGKLVGAGGGGFLLLCCPLSARQSVQQRLEGMGLRELPFGFDFNGATVLCHPPGG
jgi:D-glycero-alpha-D-manno-heptose-7-phosphate kinase